MRRVLLFLLSVLCLLNIVWAQSPAVDYDIVYVRAARAGDSTRIHLPDVSDPIRMTSGADLMLLHPDGTEEMLVPGGPGAVVDPVVSFDAQWVYYALFHDLKSSLNPQRHNASRAGSDIFKIHLKTRRIVQLTSQEWTPNTGAADWSRNPAATDGSSSSLGYGIFNLGPCPLPGGRVMFSSSRNGFLPSKDYTFPNFQLFVMDDDGRNVEQIGHLNLGSALHPTMLKDGRVMYSSYESQGARDKRLWGLWAIWPDGRHWEPLLSAFTDAQAFHFQTQLSNDNIAVVEYYNQNNNGFGTLLAFPAKAPVGEPPFGDANPAAASNPTIQRGITYQPGRPAHLKPRYKRYSFSPVGLYTLTGFTHGEDEAASRTAAGGWAGKVTDPSGGPDNDLLLVWTPGPANNLDRPTHLPVIDAGIYVIRGGTPVDDSRRLVLIKNDPRYNEIQPRAVVPYRRIYSVSEPATLPWLPNDGTLSPQLPAGTPFGMVGTSTFYKRDTKPGIGRARFNGLDAFNTTANGESSNWITQGSDAGRYSDDDIYAVRILAMEPSSHLSYGPLKDNGFRSHANERLRILGEIPLRKTDRAGRAILDVDGNPDTSFLAKIPADVPFTFQTVDKDGLALNTSQTWHQVRPGEIRNDCGGCHAHSHVGTAFSRTAAAKSDYQVTDFTRSTTYLTKDASGKPRIAARSYQPIDVEYYRDIKPVLQRSCVTCHSATGRQEARLVLDDTALVGGYENTYIRLAEDQAAQYGVPPVIKGRTWRQTNASRYIREFQARRSLLVWKVFGRRLDGWTNADFPTESTPGDPTTLPAGANANEADLDFTGTMCPPPDSGVPALSEDEKIMFARWVDLGAPISSPARAFKGRGWFQDDLRPTLTVSVPKRGTSIEPLAQIRLGAFDYYSGLDPVSLSVTANFSVGKKRPGAELAPLFVETADHVWTLRVDPPLTDIPNGTLTVSVRDKQGNATRVVRSFAIQPVRRATP